MKIIQLFALTVKKNWRNHIVNVYNFLSFFNRRTDIRIYDAKADSVSILYEGEVENLPIDSLTWRIVSVFIFSGVLTIYVEVEE